MSEKDPAAGRFVALNAMRFSGVALILLGILIANGRIPTSFPNWLGYVLIGMGVVDFFVMPLVLARRWRSPK